MNVRSLFVALSSLLALTHCRPNTTTATATRSAPTAHTVPTVPAPDAAAPSAPVSSVLGQTVTPSAWQPQCQANRQCAAVPVIARCSDASATRDFSEAYRDRHALVGQRVSIRGRLSAVGGCTEMGCLDGSCCNRCDGAVVLVADQGVSRGSSVIYFSDPDARGGPFSCTGDDSAMCCAFAADGREVAATGTLTVEQGRYVLARAELCAR
jgi:hypothetical protein